ncbi:MAG: type II toxin-antitoxin system HicB family antitoxin [Alcanivoracaceae bacterium]|nr:type II toxin-antitoxin system HicB family antitoxin [Alcanivoracaceae bacterium]
MKISDKYLKIVKWSIQDNCYIGYCPGLMLGGVHGDDEAKVYAQLCTVVDEWLEIYQKDGNPLPKATADKTYSGKFNLRVGEQLHEQLSVNAMIIGESLNSYCVKKLRNSESSGH